MIFLKGRQFCVQTNGRNRQTNFRYCPTDPDPPRCWQLTKADHEAAEEGDEPHGLAEGEVEGQRGHQVGHREDGHQQACTSININTI